MSKAIEELTATQREAVRELVDAQNDEAFEAINKRLDRIDAKLDSNNRLRNLALATAMICLIAAGFSAGYALTSRQQLDTAKAQLKNQIATNKRVVCASARSTALAFREPQISADGKAESQAHFIDRMLAQRETLRLAGPLNCSELRGFATFPFLRGRALYEIASLLYAANPKRFKPPERTRIPPPSSVAGDPSGPEAQEAPSEPFGSRGDDDDASEPNPDPPSKGGGGGKETGGGGTETSPGATSSPESAEPGGSTSTEPGASSPEPSPSANEDAEGPVASVEVLPDGVGGLLPEENPLKVCGELVKVNC
jgi:hypothetical protein